MIVIANLFSKLQTVKVLLRPLRKKCRARTPFDTQHVKGFRKTPEISKREILSYPFITLQETDLENISLGDMLNLRGVS